MLQGFQNIWICIFLMFLWISRHFQSLLFLKTKEKMKGNLASRPLDFYFLLNLGPWKRRAAGSSAWPGRNRGGRGNRESREERGFWLIQIRILLKNFFWNIENFEYESCREFKSLQLLFQEKVYSSNGLKVILNFRKLWFKWLAISCDFCHFLPLEFN